MLNRWNIEIKRGMIATACLPRGGTVTGIITAVHRMPAYGWRATIDDGTSVAIDDISRAWPVRLLRTRIEVPSPRNGKPGYRWTTGYYVVGPDCRKQYPPLSRTDAYASARQQWPGCVISIQEDV